MQHPRRQGRSLRFFLTPVAGQKYEGKPVGASILISDVTELKRAEGIRSEFTANVSHELKTPLTSIKGFTDMLASGMVTSSEDQKRFLTMIGVEVDRLIDLINDILKVSELESVAIEQCEESSDVLDTANEVANFLAPVAQKANISLKVEGVHLSAAIPFDRLKELLLNLMENGVKYNEPGGSVTVTLEDEPEMVKIIVADTGIGIPEECQSRVSRALLPGAEGEIAHKRRHGPRPCHCQAHCCAVWRPAFPAERAGERFRVHRGAAEKGVIRVSPCIDGKREGPAVFCRRAFRFSFSADLPPAPRRRAPGIPPHSRAGCAVPPRKAGA